MKPIKNTLTVHNRRYEYILRPVGKKTTFVECKAANIAQEFLNKDIPALLIDLPNLIISEKKHTAERNHVIRFRVSPGDKILIEKKAIQKGFHTVSAFLRYLALGNEKI